MKYVKETERSGFSISKAKKGFVVKTWARVIGEVTDRRMHVPYGTVFRGIAFDADCEFNKPFNNGLTLGDAIAAASIDGNVLRTGTVVQ
jgi:hypothetical protein